MIKTTYSPFVMKWTHVPSGLTGTRELKAVEGYNGFWYPIETIRGAQAHVDRLNLAMPNLWAYSLVEEN